MTIIFQLELTLDNFSVETINNIVKQFNQLIPEQASYSYSAKDVIELLIIREYMNSEIKLVKP